MERQAINFVIQASACDLMKVTMDRITQSIDRAFPHDFKSKMTTRFQRSIDQSLAFSSADTSSPRLSSPSNPR